MMKRASTLEPKPDKEFGIAVVVIGYMKKKLLIEYLK
jgi:hypothetical protein